MRRIPIFACILLFGLSVGCSQNQTVKDSWKFTTRQYRTYLNTPASLDLEDSGSCEVYEMALGEAVLNIDMELQKLIRTMENSDHNPDQNWVMGTLAKHPWLSGVALIDQEGNIVARYPEQSNKPFDASPLLEPDPKQHLGALRAYAQMLPEGPEIYLGNPVFGGEELRGVVVAHFDPRILVMMSPDPGSFSITTPVGVVWPGNYGNALGTYDWAELLQKKSCGTIGKTGAEFFWTTRYLGNLPLVYAVPTSAGHTVQPVAAPVEQAAPAEAAGEDPAEQDGNASE